MDLQQLLQQFGAHQNPQIGIDTPQVDTAETVYISSLSLLKMLKHGRAGVPMEVMGLMLGEFIDDYTVRVQDVFAMPQSGTGVSVEAVDNVFQTKMLDMLKQTGRPEIVVGWYHSHPGFGPWLSGVDINTQMSFESLNPRSVAVVIDPIQSVRGKVVIDAFRTIPQQSLMMGVEPRQTTSHLGHLQPPSAVALVHGLNIHYYSMPIKYRKNEFEQKMLLHLQKSDWILGLELNNSLTHSQKNISLLKEMLDLTKQYNKKIQEEIQDEKIKDMDYFEKQQEKLHEKVLAKKKQLENQEKNENVDQKKDQENNQMDIEVEKNDVDKKQVDKKQADKKEADKKQVDKKEAEKNKVKKPESIKNVGKLDPKKHLEQYIDILMARNIQQSLGTFLNTVVF